MLEILVLWGYMLFINCAVGSGVLTLLHRISGGRGRKIGMVPAVLAGVVTITVYAEAFSLFGKVGMLAHLLLLALALACAWFCRKALLPVRKGIRTVCFSWEGALYLIFVLLTAYFASRGLQHTDTGIYHAQAIRWYEEYGLVKGQGNLQQHFAYNSAYLAYAAAFSMKWLTGQSLHANTGFFQAFLCVWALYGLKSFFSRTNHTADACRIGILLYALVNAEGIMSPATDYGAMYLVLWIVTLWAEYACEKKGEDRLEPFCLLCVAVVCVTTYKLSAGMLVILALYPAVRLVRQKAWKRIGLYLGAGVLVLLPWLIRNVLLSGWLIYPFAAIDLFSVDWKIPLEYLQYDSDQIRVWGRCVFDVSRIDMPVWEWLPLWWEAKDRYEQMLILANVLAVPMELLAAVYGFWKCRKTEWEQALLHLAVFGGVAGWFWLAPFIRYGLAFLLVFPLLAFGVWLRRIPMGPVRIASGFCCAALFFCLSMYWDYYVLSDAVWIKRHLTDPAWLVQQDYDRVEVGEIKVDSLTVYYPLDSDNISYHAFPGTAYEMMAERSRMRGETIKDGFMPK